MFCFQCEQTAGCRACAGSVGVCGKKADTAEIQDKLTGCFILHRRRFQRSPSPGR